MSNSRLLGHYSPKTITMSEFLLLFRRAGTEAEPASPKEMQAMIQKWQDWMGSLAAQGKTVNPGQRLSMEGKVLKPGGVITDGPFVEIREILGGFIVLNADSLEEATTLAHGCPHLEVGGSVEIRPVWTPQTTQ